ncbi:MAG: Gx transporter family protein [Armatimonadetes bacterium]|nr:Gx transporter family protein [Armatimonadota bacterium]
MTKLTEDIKIQKIALLIACASALQILESLIPHPIPGVRLGLANMITVVALVNLGFKASLEIAILRTIISSFIMGTFLSPTFILSFSGAVTSTIVMGIIFRLSTLNRKVYFSLVGISLMGAFTHNIVQISLVYLLLIKHKGIFLLLPWLGISAVVMGWITGLVASQVCRKLETISVRKDLEELVGITSAPFSSRNYVQSDSSIHLLHPILKISFVFILAVAVLILNNFIVYSIILIFLIIVIQISRIPILNIFSRIRKLSVFLFFSFIIPVLLSRNGEILVDLGFLQITQEGLLMGFTFVFRIVLLMLSATLMMMTTSPEELASGLKKLLSPFEIIGVSGDRVSTIITASISYIPDSLKRVHHFIKLQKFSGKTFRRLIPALSDLIVVLYQQADEQTEETRKNIEI